MEAKDYSLSCAMMSVPNSVEFAQDCVTWKECLDDGVKVIVQTASGRVQTKVHRPTLQVGAA